MNIKKSLSAVLLSAIIIASFAACSSKGEKAETKDEPPAVEETLVVETEEEPVVEEPAVSETKAIADVIKDNVTMKDDLELIESDRNIENAYPGIMDLIDESTVYVNASGGYAEEIAVFVLKEGKDMDDLIAKMNERIEYQKTVFADYQPREMPKLEDPVMVTDADIMVLVIADDSAQANAAIEKALE